MGGRGGAAAAALALLTVAVHATELIPPTEGPVVYAKTTSTTSTNAGGHVTTTTTATAASLDSLPLANLNMTALELLSFCDDHVLAGLKENAAVLLMHENGQLTKATLLAARNRANIFFGRASMLGSVIAATHPTKAMRTLGDRCGGRVTSAQTNYSLNREHYDAVVSVADQLAETNVDAKAYADMLTSFRRSGVHLPPDKRAKVQELVSTSSSYGGRFRRNIDEDVRYVMRNADDTTALAGLPDDYIATRTVDGKVVMSTNYPDYQPAMKLAQDPSLRRDLYIAFHSRGFPENIEHLEKMLQARHDMAVLLGYPTYAHYATEELMIKSPERVDAFLAHVAAATEQQAEEDLRVLLAAKRIIDPSADHVESYDAAFLTEAIKESSNVLNTTEVRKYFRFSSTRAGVLKTVSKLFDLRFEKDNNVAVWHKDVTVYRVYPANSQRLMGRFVLDMFPRPGKFSHAAHYAVTKGITGVQVPEAVLVCNFPKNGPMEHAQVVTFFHEFGHLMHHIIGGQFQKYSDQSGVATERDFVEAPSQLLEELAYDVDVLRQFAQTEEGEPIPPALVTQMQDARVFGRSLAVRQQLLLSRVSLELHLQAVSATSDEVVERLENMVGVYPHVPGSHMQASFGHLVGYSSNYYTYVWSQAAARHMLVQFRDHGRGINNVAIGRRYRDQVLKPGGSMAADALVESFTGFGFGLEAFDDYLAQKTTAAVI